MKIILAGSTGFIGQEILFQCLSSPQITSIVVLSRRALNVEDPKLKIVILEDFTDIPEHVMEKLKGCEGVIWYDDDAVGSFLFRAHYPAEAILFGLFCFILGREPAKLIFVENT